MGKRDVEASQGLMRFFLFLFLSLSCSSISAALNRDEVAKVQTLPSKSRISPVFAVNGTVYPDGYYYAVVTIANKPYFLDIDTGSVLTWVQCDAPCKSCLKAPHLPHKPNLQNLIPCKDPMCTSMGKDISCNHPNDQCDYEVSYADNGSTLGVLLRDTFSFPLSNGSSLGVSLAFGCGYDQRIASNAHPSTDGVLGLGSGKVSVISQLSSQGSTRSVIGHCLNSQGVGFMFLGDGLIPSSGISWVSSSTQQHYSVGPAELLLGSKTTGVKGLSVIFDSGSSYTYFNSHNYQSILSLIKRTLNGKALRVATDDNTLPVCWKGSKPFKTVGDVLSTFSPLALRIGGSKGALFSIPPSAYLIISARGNVCLGILNGTEAGLGSLNVVGDVSMQDKLVIYDNDNQKIGWTSFDCSKFPKS